MVAATESEADSAIRNQRTIVTSFIWLGLTAWADFSPCDICGDLPSGKLTLAVRRATRLVGTSAMKRRNEYFILVFLLSVTLLNLFLSYSGAS
jgi:hypothetical protein